MKKLSADEVADLMRKLPGGRHGEVAYAKEVEDLDAGEGFIIKADEWTRKTSLPAYFSGKFNRGGTRTVKCAQTEEGNYLIVKL